MTPDQELAWAAGLFEGEGSVRISKPALRNWGSLNVDVPNTDHEIIAFFADRWHGSVHHVEQQGRRREYWRWRCASLHAATFLRAIEPFVVTERVRGRIAHGLAFQDQKLKSRAARTEEYREAQWIAYWWMAELNLRGAR